MSWFQDVTAAKIDKSDGGGGTPPPVVTTPETGGKGYMVFEIGLGEEVQVVQILTIAGTEHKARPVAAGPVAFDCDAPNGGTVKVFQADSLPDLISGRVRAEVWTFTAGQRDIKGLAPTRRFVVLAIEGEAMKVQPRALGWATRGPSVWQRSTTVHAWPGV